MDIDAVMDELGDAVDSIAGLRVDRYPPEAITPPVAIIAYPDAIDYDATYGRGMDRITAAVVVVVGRVSARASKKQLTAYMNGSGSKSIKAAIGDHTPTSYDVARVVSAETDVFEMAGGDYISAVFEVDVVGSGT